MHLYEELAKQNRKSMSVIAFCTFALTRHPTVIVATSDLAGTLEKLRQHFPRNLIDTVEGGLRIHRVKE